MNVNLARCIDFSLLPSGFFLDCLALLDLPVNIKGGTRVYRSSYLLRWRNQKLPYFFTLYCLDMIDRFSPKMSLWNFHEMVVMCEYFASLLLQLSFSLVGLRAADPTYSKTEMKIKI